MKYKEIEKKYGKSTAKKILKKLDGQTVGINKDGSFDYYESDVEKAFLEIQSGKKVNDWD